MTMKTLVPIAVALTLALGAIPAAAKHRSHERPEAKLVRLAHELHEATSGVRRSAVAPHGHWSNRHWRALLALQNLDHNAHRFYWTVNRKGPQDRDTRRAFRRLERSYRIAQHSFRELRGARGLHRDSARVERLMHRIDIRLAQYDGRHRPSDHWRNGRRDHWRYGDRDEDGRWRISWAFDF